MRAPRSLLIALFGLHACAPVAATAPKPAPVPRGQPAKPKIPQGIQPASAIGAQGGGPVLSDGCARTPHRFAQPIAVTEDAQLDRYPPVLGFPIPFPRGGNLQSLTGFVASTPRGESLATQAEVLSRWGDGPEHCEAPIRWAYVFAAATPPAGERAFLTLRHDPGLTPAPPIRLLVDRTDARVVITTGPARFTIRQDWFNGLSKVELLKGEAWNTVLDVPSRGDVGLLVQHRSQLASPIHGKVTSFELERKGPVVATLAVKGSYAFRGGDEFFRYTTRFHFYAGSSAVQVDHTYYNGATTGPAAEDAKNLKVSDRVFMRLPLQLGGAPVVQVRANEQVHGLSPRGVISVQQYKRSPDRPAVAFAVRHAGAKIELGGLAENPFVAAVGQSAYVVGTIAWMDRREPQALRFDPKVQALEVDWQSEELFVGGAKGIWSRAALDFGFAGAVDMSTRADQLQAHITRPLIGAPRPAYVNQTHAYGLLPASELPKTFRQFDSDVDVIHARTVDYLRRYKITGTQIWPDLGRNACVLDSSCGALDSGYFEAGGNNQWDWAMVELEQFLRTADPAFVHDFALPEAITMAETVTFRPSETKGSKPSQVAGLSPCSGASRKKGAAWTEGLTHRTGACPGDQSFNKLHRLAYILTADRRFTDLFSQGARTAIRRFGKRPKSRPAPLRELSASLPTAQYLEPLLTAAEFGRIGGDKTNRRHRDAAKQYFDFMSTRALQNGHVCSLLGTGHNTPNLQGECKSIEQWKLPVFVDWTLRLHYLYGHEPSREWALKWARQSVSLAATMKDSLPDISQATAQSGWRSRYECKATKVRGVGNDTCKMATGPDSGAQFDTVKLLAYLNALAMVVEVDTKDSLKLCAWLPQAYALALARMDREGLNDHTWGRPSGIAYAFAQRALGALLTCKSPAPPAP